MSNHMIGDKVICLPVDAAPYFGTIFDVLKKGVLVQHKNTYALLSYGRVVNLDHKSSPKWRPYDI